MSGATALTASSVDGWQVTIDSTAFRQQDEEFLHLCRAGINRRVRFHDYAQLYEIPGLYDWVFYEALGCRSHEVAVAAFSDVADRHAQQLNDLAVLDLGAGNGIIGRELNRRGVAQVFGLDILEQAKQAAVRDNPGVYEDYLVADLLELGPEQRGRLERFAPTALITVAALGFGDIPVAAFASAVHLLRAPGWVVFTIKREFLDDPDRSSFGAHLQHAVNRGDLEIHERRPFTHRVSATGEALDYLCVVARNLRATSAMTGKPIEQSTPSGLTNTRDGL